MERIFETWQAHNNTRYLAVPSPDWNSVSIVDEHGEFYGVWEGVEAFKSSQAESRGAALVQVRQTAKW